MLYELHEMQQAAVAPFRLWAELGLKFLDHSAQHVPPLHRYLSASYELFLRATHRYEKPEFGLRKTEIDGTQVSVSEEVVIRKPFCHLLHFKRASKQAAPRVLVVAPLSGHFATLLRDTVKALLPDHDVYITDWVDARLVPASQGPFHFDDYVSYVQEFIRYLGRDCHVISVCQPTVPVLVAISLMAAAGDVQPKTMTMMGGPIDARRSPTLVNRFAQHRSLHWFERRMIYRVPAKYAGHGRRVYPGFLQLAGFVAINPDRHVNSHRKFFEHLVVGDGESAAAHRRFYDEYNAVMDLPAEFYLDTVKSVFQDFSLPRGEMISLGEHVRPEAITKPALFTIEGELDDISGNGQTAAAHDLCRGIAANRKQHLLAPSVGHYGIFSGRKFRESIYPQMRAFIRQHA